MVGVREKKHRALGLLLNIKSVETSKRPTSCFKGEEAARQVMGLHNDEGAVRGSALMTAYLPKALTQGCYVCPSLMTVIKKPVLAKNARDNAMDPIQVGTQNLDFLRGNFSTSEGKGEHFFRCWLHSSCRSCLDADECSWCPYVSTLLLFTTHQQGSY